MTPFEDLIRELSFFLEINLHPDSNQSCTLHFLQEDVTIQIDLDTNADQILVGIQLGRIPPGSFRELVFTRALQMNGACQTAEGILAFSEKNDTLVLFRFLPLEKLNGEKLHAFLQIFREQALLWQSALIRGEAPPLPVTATVEGSGMFGLS